ncbi:MAG: hypothetical protein COS14_08005 [Bacteroidetes bacterium CG02_land_8_20_14_3_00_31_25]|nr:flippase-like domain-containing protein [Bacteroidota bacterium]PIV58731.1 MAG: hypothetical protein COS14_08005 [Bacteroidetes bacterium CG02_land_8_20_14_3_00_31_25]PIY07417.1 MAG: hypothetical protein COZ21_00395 [Bacteroidetes bacterium CG_4_10_14_3_um_filter_31_20]
MKNNILFFFKTHYFTIIKWLIFIGSLLFIINKIFFQQEFKQILNYSKFSNINNILYLLMVLILMTINWGIESFKWKLAVNKFNQITFFKSYSAILSGIAVSIFMPNRTGEFVGRIFFLKSENRVKGTIASIITSYSQLIATIIFGSIGILLLYIFYPVNVLTQNKINWLINIPVFVVATISTLLYFKIKWFSYFIENWKFLKKYSDSAKLLNSYKLKELFVFLVLSIIRYFVFLLQFYLLIKVFNIDISFLQSIIASIITFYVSTIIPTFAIAEIGVRGTVASIFFGFFSNMQTEIIFASTLLWIINIGIPAIIGNIFVAKYKFQK